MRKSNYLLLFVCTAVLFLRCSNNSASRISYFINEFKEQTGLPFEGDSKIIKADEFRAAFGDGEIYIVFQINESSINNLIKNRPCWNEQWEKGPIPADLRYFSFDVQKYKDPPVLDEYRKKNEYNIKIDEIVNSSNIYYSVFDCKYCDIPWENGKILIIDPKSKWVLFSKWDQ